MSTHPSPLAGPPRQPAPPPAARRPPSRPSRFARAQRMSIVNAILVIVVLIVILQLWLLTATMNAFLGGDHGILLTAALVSLFCLGLIGGLIWYLYRLED